MIAMLIAIKATRGVAVLILKTNAKSGMATTASPNPKADRIKVDTKMMINTHNIFSSKIIDKLD